MHAQPQAISKNATKNNSAPTGKIAAIRIPAPIATAKIPRMQPPPFPRNMVHTPLCFQYIQWDKKGEPGRAGEFSGAAWFLSEGLPFYFFRSQL